MKDEIRIQAKKIASRFGKNNDEKQDIEIKCIEAVWKAQDKLDEEKNPNAYINRIMINAAKTHIRSSQKINELSISSNTKEERDRISEVEASEVFENFISTLESPDKDIVLLLVQGYDHKEIASRVGLTPEIVNIRIYRGRKKWKKYFKDE